MTKKQIKIIRELAEGGKSWASISKELDVHESTIRKAAKQNGIKSQYRRASWKEQDMINAIKSSVTISDVLRKLNLKVRPGNYDTVNKFINKNNIDISHMTGNKTPNKIQAKKPLEEVLVENSNFSRHALKRRLLKENLIKNECEICGQKDKHNDKPLTMVLDHINGINNDNRLENLRMLCPNCNSQTDTFCSREPSEKSKCPDCGGKKSKKAKLCFSCSKNKPKKITRKIERPSKEELEKMIEEMSWVAIGKKYGVSDNAVRKWAKAYKII